MCSYVYSFKCNRCGNIFSFKFNSLLFSFVPICTLLFSFVHCTAEIRAREICLFFWQMVINTFSYKRTYVIYSLLFQYAHFYSCFVHCTTDIRAREFRLFFWQMVINTFRYIRTYVSFISIIYKYDNILITDLVPYIFERMKMK